MRIGTDGSLTIYPVGIDRIGRSWRADPDAPAEEPWIVPRDVPAARLIERPIVIR
jgi:hypothetical protein